MSDKTHLVDGKYGIRDLVDLDELRRMFERFTEATGFTIGFLDHPDLNVLIATGWRDICTQFHRGCPVSADNCTKSNRRLLDHLDEPGKLLVEKCENGLVDCAFPIIIDGQHIASLATGQLLLEEPDLDQFRRQARLFGFDEHEYLKALAEVPVVSEAKLRSVTTFLGEMALVLSQIGLARLTSIEKAEHLEKEIASRRQAEEALKESEDRLQQAVSVSGMGVFDHDHRADVIHWTLEMRKIHGFGPDDPVSLPTILACVHPEDRQRVAEAIERAHDPAGNGRYAVEHRIVRRDGEIRWLIRRAQTFFEGEAGARTPVRTFGAVLDITERTRAEIRLRRLYECGMIAILYWNVEGVVTDANDAFLAMIGYDREDLAAGRTEWGGITPLEYRHLDEAAFESLKRTGAHAPYEKEYICKDGRRIRVLIGGAFLDESCYEGVNFVLDITDRKRAEEERRKLEAQLQHSQKLESLGVLAGGIAHDFNNLLVGVLGNADLALTELPRESPARANIKEVEKAARRAADLCRQMLAYSGKGRFVAERLDLSAVVREMAQMLEVGIARNVTLKRTLGENLPPIEADATQVRQVVMNLITNASEAIAGDDGMVSICTGVMNCDRAYLDTMDLGRLSAGRYVFMEVSDTGCGMDRETQQRMFEPFFTTKFAGRGLGLAAVLGIVRGHKGGIKIYSEPGRGTTIKVLFPAAAGSASADEAEHPADEEWKGSGTVLVVDDEETVLTASSRMLQKAGFSVITAHDGQQALDLFRQNPDGIACVLLDLTMPRMGGEAAFRELRRIRPDVRVVLTSGYNEQDVVQRFAGKGLTGFIQKPYQMAALLACLRRVMLSEAGRG